MQFNLYQFIKFLLRGDPFSRGAIKSPSHFQISTGKTGKSEKQRNQENMVNSGSAVTPPQSKTK